MHRFAGPQWRIPGAIVAWVLFAASFVLVYVGAGLLVGLGGYCASGGPYVIETECPADLLTVFPIGFAGTFVAPLLSFVFQGGFAAPVWIWSWPILFVGIGIQFFGMIAIGAAFVGILCGTIFVLMGIGPLVFELRAGPRRLVLGKSDTRDVRFAERPGVPRTIYAFSREDVTVPVTGRDWLLSLGVTIPSIAAGVLLGLSIAGGLT